MVQKKLCKTFDSNPANCATKQLNTRLPWQDTAVPLFIAALCGRAGAVRALVKAGAAVNIQCRGVAVEEVLPPMLSIN